MGVRFQDMILPNTVCGKLRVGATHLSQSHLYGFQKSAPPPAALHGGETSAAWLNPDISYETGRNSEPQNSRITNRAKDVICDPNVDGDANATHAAWQAGIRFFLSFLLDQTGWCFGRRLS
jgi:hypothetical protein